MPANQYGFDLGEVYRNQNALAGQRQQQQLNAFAIGDAQRKQDYSNALQGAPDDATRTAIMQKYDPNAALEYSGKLDAQSRQKHADAVKATTDTLGALDGVPDEQLADATNAARAHLQSQGYPTAAIDQALQASGGDPKKLRGILRQQALQGLDYAKQLDQQNNDRAYKAGRDDAANREKDTAETRKAQAARDAEAARHDKATEGQAAATLAETKRQHDAAMATGPKLTEDQAKSGGFADRAAEGDTILGDPSVVSAGMDLTQQGKARVPVVGNFLVSDNYQKYDQAARNFINATLRRDSGAAISDGEWDNARKQYLPQPGDSKAVLAQKAANRKTVIGSLGRSAGPGYKSATPAAPASSGGWKIERVGS